MGNLRQKYTDEEWDELELSIKEQEEAKKQAIKDMQKEFNSEEDKSILKTFGKYKIDKDGKG